MHHTIDYYPSLTLDTLVSYNLLLFRIIDIGRSYDPLPVVQLVACNLSTGEQDHSSPWQQAFEASCVQSRPVSQ